MKTNDFIKEFETTFPLYHVWLLFLFAIGQFYAREKIRVKFQVASLKQNKMVVYIKIKFKINNEIQNNNKFTIEVLHEIHNAALIIVEKNQQEQSYKLWKEPIITANKRYVQTIMFQITRKRHKNQGIYAEKLCNRTRFMQVIKKFLKKENSRWRTNEY